jgi:hypothetical protein
LAKRNPNLRKCFKCKEDIDILNEDYIKENKQCFHMNCFIDKQNIKGLSEEAINEKIKVLRQQMAEEQKIKDQKELEKVQKKNSIFRDKLLDEEYKKQFITWIQEVYNINNLDKSFYIKLANINNGTYKDLQERISYEDLLYMFKTKQSYLDKIANDKIKKGQPFQDSKHRLNFDLAVIINKYDSYKQWKEKQKLLEIEVKKDLEIKKDKGIDINKLNNNRKKQENNYNIEDILNDIY